MTEQADSISTSTDTDDPFLWLEDVTGDEALTWVRSHNEPTVETLSSSDRFRDMERRPWRSSTPTTASRSSGAAANSSTTSGATRPIPRGLWRRTTLESYVTDAPDWEIIIDVDELARAEDENWVWSGATVLRPDYERALVSLSRGGADATVIREFDIPPHDSGSPTDSTCRRTSRVCAGSTATPSTWEPISVNSRTASAR